MRHQYVPVFREFTTSSMWAKSPAVRCVWLYLMLHADPEGFVPGTIPGLAVAANVDIEDTRAAVASFMAPDPDSNTQEHEGRRLEKVPHGWRILNFVYWRELAKKEAEKARKRTWMQAHRKRQLSLPFPPEFLPPDDDDAPSTDVHTSTLVDARAQTVDAPKPKPKPTPKPEGEGSPLPPVLDVRDTDPTWVDPPGPFDEPEPVVRRVRPVVFSLEGWEPPHELRNESVMVGVQKFDEHIARLRTGPIGGSRGVFKDEIDDYIRSMFGKWRTWEETDRAKDAQRSAATASPLRRPFDRTHSSVVEPNGRQRAFAAKHGIDINQLVKDLTEEGVAGALGEGRAKEMLGERLAVAVKQKRHGQPVTGKLTPQQLAEWGAPQTGGAIPEVA